MLNYEWMDGVVVEKIARENGYIVIVLRTETTVVIMELLGL